MFRPLENAKRPPLASRTGLSERVANLLAEHIASGILPRGARLQSEDEIGRQLGVSRTVVREAVSRLKSDGVLESYQGSGVYVSEETVRPLRIGRLTSIDDVLHIVALRRAIEAQAAALAAKNRTAGELQTIEHALGEIDAAVARGGDGVDEDVAFHRRIAEASGNPYFLSVLDFVSQYLRNATRVTRSNESRRSQFMDQVRNEHRAIVAAIAAGNAAAAERAAARHMRNAAERIRVADPDLFRQETVSFQANKPRQRQRA
jgi:GntR family transcriptional repressor for pyruvate dehydrogenase complex